MDDTLEPVADDARVNPPGPNPSNTTRSYAPDSADLGEPSRARAGQKLAQGYVIQRLLARGAMGRVYLATQTPPGREVAVKCIEPQPSDDGFRKRFAVEAATAARLNHRHIVTVHDYGETDAGEPFLTMEYLRGEPLSRVIQREGRLTSQRACRVALQICRALRYSHSQGVVHRDLVPTNIMLLRDEDGDLADFIKVLDFGLVKAYQRGNDPGNWTGSPRYMAPEQIRRKEVDVKSDIYSLGAIMFHMLSGRPPFIGATSVEIFSQHLKDPVPWIRDVGGASDVAPELEVVVRRCLEKDAARRYQSADDLMADLKAALRLIDGSSGFGEPLGSSNVFDPNETSLSGSTLSALPVRAARVSLPSLDDLAVEAGLAEAPSVEIDVNSGRPAPADLPVTSPGIADLASSAAARPSLPAVSTIEETPRPALPVPSLAPTSSTPSSTPSRPPAPADALESDPPLPAKGPPIWAIIAAVLAIAAAVYFIFGSSPAPTSQAPAPAPSTAPALVDAELSIRSRPSGAAVFLEGVQIGVTPLAHAVRGKIKGSELELVFRLEGHTERAVKAKIADEPVIALDVKLDPKAAPVASATPAATPRPSPSATAPAPVASRGGVPDAPQKVPDSVIPGSAIERLGAPTEPSPKPSVRPEPDEPRVGNR